VEPKPRPRQTSLACEEVRPFLSAVAIGALDTDEAAEVAQHLLECRDCRQELDRLSDTVDLIGFVAPQIEPPTGLRASFLSQLGDEPTGVPVPAPVTRIMPWRWIASIAAALIVVLLAGNILLQLRDSNGAAPAATQASGTRVSAPLVWYDVTAAGPQAGQATGFLCAQETGRLAWLIVQDLPALPAGKTYQAWLSNGDQRINAGTFTVDEKGRGFLTIRLSSTAPLEHFTALGVTEEPSGGSPNPSGPRFLSASL
jgi:anti-sigma-K factor RskA